MKFNKVIKFEAAQRDRKSVVSNTNSRTSHQVSRQACNKNNHHLKSPPLLDSKNGVSILGQAGLFSRIQNDFTINIDHDHDDLVDDGPSFRDKPHWTNDKREKVKRVRFVVCTLALTGLAFALMSRLMLNVSIVEMVKAREINVPIEEDTIVASETTNAPTSSLDPYQENELLSLQSANSTDNIIHAQANEFSYDYDDGLHFNWTKREVNIVIGSFYIGYMPGILLSSGIAQRFGAKYPLLVCLLGTSIINALTPAIARFNLTLLISSRILLGLIQGGLLPALYELFNKWLTLTESSIFAPMIKVSIPMGSVIGTLMPGLLASLGLEWPYLFYSGGFMCLAWSIVWFYVATSTPQKNKYVEEDELRRIMRKKVKPMELSAADMADNVNEKQLLANSSQFTKKKQHNGQTQTTSTPWFLIITNPSVLALTLVKFTYNIGMDFVYLEIAVYLRNAHSASIEKISIIASSGYCMQMILITFVGWIAKTVVSRRTFGFSVTKWRKIFQSGSNFLMAFIYCILALSNPGLELSACLLITVCFFWMLGAGGESMVPYDLSSKYPASIVGLTHSISVLSGIAVPAVFDIIIGEETHDPERWRLLFMIMASALAFGGLIFGIVLKAKPFLAEEQDGAPNSNQTNGHSGINNSH